MNINSFYGGRISLDDFLQLVFGLGINALNLRVLALKTLGDPWASFVASLRSVDVIPATNEVLVVGPATLISIHAEVNTIWGNENLRGFLESWRELVDGPSFTPRYVDELEVSRLYSFSPYSHKPCWRGAVADLRTETHFRMPKGPLFSPSAKIFEDSVWSLAARWTGIPGSALNNQPLYQLQTIIDDPRARFVSGQRSNLDIEIQVETGQYLQAELYCCATAVDFRGNEHSQFHRVKDGRTSFAIPPTCRSLELHLLDDQGYEYDHLIETDQVCNTPFSVLGLVRRGPGPESEDLQEALNRGESEHLELKSWIPLDRENDKSSELLRTVCAFANTDGGVLYIGVTDDLQVCGVSKDLHKLRPGTRLEDAREDYANQISRLISEGVSPPIGPEISWISHAGIYVLRIRVPPASSPIHYVVETGHTYVRRGANSTIAKVQDLQKMAMLNSNLWDLKYR